MRFLVIEIYKNTKLRTYSEPENTGLQVNNCDGRPAKT